MTDWPAGITHRHTTTWHECGHAVVALALECDVDRVMVEGTGRGMCEWFHRGAANQALAYETRLRSLCASLADYRDPDWHLVDACRELEARDAADDPYVRGGAPCVAGAVAAMMRRQELGIPQPLTSERMSSGDRSMYRRYQEMSPDPPAVFLQACVRLATDTLKQHWPAFLALVDALLEQDELGETEILALWQRHSAV